MNFYSCAEEVTFPCFFILLYWQSNWIIIFNRFAPSCSAVRGCLLFILLYNGMVKNTPVFIGKLFSVHLNSLNKFQSGTLRQNQGLTRFYCFISLWLWLSKQNKICLHCALSFISHFGRKSLANYWQNPQELMKLFITGYFCPCHKAWCRSQRKSFLCINNHGYCSTFINSASAD